MRHAITDLDKAQALLDDLEPTSGGRAALEAEIAHMYRKDPEREPPADEPEPPYQAPQAWNGSVLLCIVVTSCLICALLVFVMRRV